MMSTSKNSSKCSSSSLKSNSENRDLTENIEHSMFLAMGSDVRKAGYLKKLKTMKKKYFVLRNDSSPNCPARLDYYDNEKKFKSTVGNGATSGQPKRSIVLKTCFSINRKIDAKHKYAIALYTKDDCFAVAFDDETQLDEWLEEMLSLQTSSSNLGIVDPRLSRPHYDYVWQVKIINNGLGQSRNMTGTYRLCLTQQALYIVKVNPASDQPDSYEFPLISIRRCGNASNASAFMLELGRSSSIGPGELWIQAEDPTVAHHMHEVIINAMKSSKGNEEFGPRPRSSSASTSEKPISSSSSTQHRRNTQTQSAFANQAILSNLGNSSTSGAHQLMVQNNNTPPSNLQSLSYNSSSSYASSVRERCDSMPTRNYEGVSVGNNNNGAYYKLSYPNEKFHSGGFPRTMSYSPPVNNPLSPSSGACSTESFASSISTDDQHHHQHHADNISDQAFQHHQNLSDYHFAHLSIPSEPPITEEDQVDDYFMMNPNDTIQSVEHQSPRAHLNLNLRKQSSGSPMTSPAIPPVLSHKEESGYLAMSPVGSVEAESLISSRRSSGIVDKITSAEHSSTEYVSMVSTSSGMEMKSPIHPLDEGFLDVSQLSSSLPKGSTDYMDLSGHRHVPSHLEEFHLDKVKSYFAPAEDDSLDYIKPVRAYSIGSRPHTTTIPMSSLKHTFVHPRTKLSSMNPTNSSSAYSYTSPLASNDDSHRVRAYSTESHSNHREKARIAARKKAIIEEQLGGASSEIADASVKASNKCSSAPALSSMAPRMRSATVGCRPTTMVKTFAQNKTMEDWMEIDYSKTEGETKSYKDGKKSQNDDKNRRSSSSKIDRQRSNSRSSSSSSGFKSDTTSSPSITSSMNELNERRKERSSSISFQNQMKLTGEGMMLAGKQPIEKDNDYLQVVITANNNLQPETKPQIFNKSSSNDSSAMTQTKSTTGSNHDAAPSNHFLSSHPAQVQTSNSSTFFSSVSPAKNRSILVPKSSSQSQPQQPKHSLSSHVSSHHQAIDDSGDYVCLDRTKTSLPSLVNINSSQNTNPAGELLMRKTSMPDKSLILSKSDNKQLPSSEKATDQTNISKKLHNESQIVKKSPSPPVIEAEYMNVDVNVNSMGENNSTNQSQTRKGTSCPNPGLTNITLTTSSSSWLKTSPDRNSSLVSNDVTADELASSSKYFQPLNASTLLPTSSGTLYENVSLGGSGGSSSSSRPSSVSSERELNYASLELPASLGVNHDIQAIEIEKTTISKSTRPLKSAMTISNSNLTPSLAPPVTSITFPIEVHEPVTASDSSIPLSYAEIDFKKSDSLKNANNGRTT